MLTQALMDKVDGGEVRAGRTSDERRSDEGLRVQLRAATVSLSTARPGCKRAT